MFLLFLFLSQKGAKRMYDSRLGAAFTIALPFVLGIAAVQTFGTRNLLVTKTLVPFITLQNMDTNNTVLYKSLNITLETYAPSTDFDCNQILPSFSLAQGLTECAYQSYQTRFEQSAIFCQVSMSCFVSGKIRGRNTIEVQFPAIMQKIKWSVITSSWESSDPSKSNKMHSSFGPSIAKNESLVGTKTKPTTVSFGVMRSRFEDRFDTNKEITEHGIQLSYLGVSKNEDKIGTADESHHVSFIFDIEESVFVKTHQQRVETLTRVATMFALLLSAISGMRFFKTYLELIIDTICLRCYPKNLPNDVRDRKDVLEERNLKHVVHNRTGHRGSIIQSVPNNLKVVKNNKKIAEVEGNENAGDIELANIELATGDLKYKKLEMQIQQQSEELKVMRKQIEELLTRDIVI